MVFSENFCIFARVMREKDFNRIKKEKSFITANCGELRYVMFCRKVEYLPRYKGIVKVYPYCYILITNNADDAEKYSEFNLVPNENFFFNCNLCILSSSNERDIRKLWYYVKKKVLV